MTEQWKTIKEYDRYEISNFGNVRRKTYTIYKSDKTTQTFKQKKMKISVHTSGYAKIKLTNDTKSKSIYVHRLVAEAFISRIKDKNEVNHIDENKLNNHISNLEWVNRSENIRHNNLHKRIGLKNRGKGAKKVLQYDLNKKFIKEWESFAELKRHGFNHKNVWRTCQVELGKKQTEGFFWSYS